MSNDLEWEDGHGSSPAGDPADDEDDGLWVPVSAIEHYSYCARQCALIHIEQTFEDNEFTVRGHLAHERVDAGGDTVTEGVRVMRGVPLWSARFRLHGKADLIEFRQQGPYPVEYKVGRRRGAHADLQLCAQALCLEEMLGVAVPRGAIYYGALRRRHEVVIGEGLRERTVRAIAAVRHLLGSQELPAPADDQRCRRCSLVDACLPAVVAEPARLRGLQGALFHPYSDGEEAGDTA